METHYKFRDGEQRKFLLEVASKSGLSTEQLAKIVGFSARNYRDWLRGKYAIASSAADTLSRNFDVPFQEIRRDLIGRWYKNKSEAGKIGGYVHFKLYGSPATPEGRIKGGLRALEVCRKKGLIPEAKTFTFPEKHNTDLAEFVGILLGDGGITRVQVGITLNRTMDKEYLKFVVELGLKLFGDTGSIYKKKDCNADVIVYSGVNFVKYLQSIGLKIGNKVKQQVSVPEWIEQKSIYSKACLRGLMDTDGCIARSLHKYKSKVYRYYNPCFTNRSKPLLEFVTRTMKNLGWHPCVAGYHVWLYNKAEVRAYSQVIGSSNWRLLRYLEESDSGQF